MRFLYGVLVPLHVGLEALARYQFPRESQPLSSWVLWALTEKYGLSLSDTEVAEVKLNPIRSWSRYSSTLSVPGARVLVTYVGIDRNYLFMGGDVQLVSLERGFHRVELNKLKPLSIDWIVAELKSYDLLQFEPGVYGGWEEKHLTYPLNLELLS